MLLSFLSLLGHRLFLAFTFLAFAFFVLGSFLGALVALGHGTVLLELDKTFLLHGALTFSSGAGAVDLWTCQPAF